jgi:hypothetical protein
MWHRSGWQAPGNNQDAPGFSMDVTLPWFFGAVADFVAQVPARRWLAV